MLHMRAQLYGIDISFTVLAVISVLLRLWARHGPDRKYGWDDWLAVIATFTLFANFGLNALMIEHGLGIQASQVPLTSLITIGKAIYADEVVYVVHLALVKVSILVMYCRVFVLQQFKVAAWILGSITVAWSLMFVFVAMFQCNPIARAWNLTIPGKCLYLRGIFIGNAVPNIVTDAAILAMPVHQVWKLHVGRSQRIAFTGIFLLGGFVIFASAYRFSTILKLDPMNLSYTLKTPTTWSHVECSVALISACLPTLRPVLTAFMKAVGVTESDTTNEPSSSSHSSDSGKGKITKKPRTDKKAFKSLRENSEGWLHSETAIKMGTALHVIRVRHDVEQSVEHGNNSGDWVNGKHKSWYPS